MEEKAWAGVDIGKGFHWAHVVDASGTELLSRRVENDEADLLALIDEALSLAEEAQEALEEAIEETHTAFTADLEELREEVRGVVERYRSLVEKLNRRMARELEAANRRREYLRQRIQAQLAGEPRPGGCKPASKELANLRAGVSLSSLFLMVFHPT